MTWFLEAKERIRSFCNRFEIYLMPVCKAGIAFLLFYLISTRLGYSDLVKGLPINIVLALVCALLPANTIVAIGAILVLINMYALSLAALIVTAAVFFIIFILYFRLSPQKGIYAALTPILAVFNVPYITPISIGLLDDDPSAVFSVAAGSLSYYMIKGISANASAIGFMGEEDTILTKISDILNQLITDREMLFMTALYVATALIVWAVRRLKVDYSWIIAIAIGAVMQFAGRYVIDLNLHMSTDFLRLVLGVLAAVAVGFVLQFFFFNLDYERTERVQFEDEEYYYYVKAIPKRFVTESDKKIKKFSSHTEDDIEPGEARRRLAREMQIEDELLDFRNVDDIDLESTNNKNNKE